MRPTLVLLLATAVFAAPPDEGAPVLRGADLAQFELVGIGPESIAIADGEVRLSGRPLGYFATKEDFGDFVLTFEWKYDRPEGLASDATFRGNSGVLVRVARPRKVWPDCIQVQLAQADPGTLFAMGEASLEGRSLPQAQRAAVRPVGQWNRSEVTCRGGTIRSVLNGVEVARGEAARPARGAIAWQSEGQPIRFRSIRVRKTD